MDAQRYKVVFSGKLVDGAKASEVLTRLTTLLQKSEPEVRELFKAGNGAVIFDDLGGSQAYARQEDLRGIGVIASVKEIPPPPPPEQLSGTMQTMGTPAPGTAAARPRPAQHSYHPPSSGSSAPPSGSGRLIIALLILAAVIAAAWWVFQSWPAAGK